LPIFKDQSKTQLLPGFEGEVFGEYEDQCHSEELDHMFDGSVPLGSMDLVKVSPEYSYKRGDFVYFNCFWLWLSFLAYSKTSQLAEAAEGFRIMFLHTKRCLFP